MASPPAGYPFPPTAHSPPYPCHSQLPPINTKMSKKRPSEGGASGPAPSLKRRKPSAVSVASGAGGGSAHPLRQTANARDEVGTPFTERSPSVDMDNMSFVSGSQVSAAGPPKKKRGRKPKADKAREQTPSAVSGRRTVAGSEVGGRAGGNSVVAADDGAEVPDEEGPIEVTATENFSMEQRQEEKDRMHILVNALSPEQFHRLENYRVSGLAKASIRRLINQTISQSVSDNIVIGARTISKLHLGKIIESARKIQQEWIIKGGEKQTDLPTPPPEVDGVPVVSDTENPGPLRPEHLREAVRRHKMAFEAGGVGLNQTWQMQNQSGVERFPTRTGGRRIFR